MPLSGGMTYLFTHPNTSLNTLRRIDIAPLAALYMAAIAGFEALRIAGTYRRMPAASRKIGTVVRALIKAKMHNHHVDLKLRMLLNPQWRKRVLRELGGPHKLGLWMTRLMRLEGRLPSQRRARPVQSEPVWWRSPEHIAQSEALKAHARLCAKACAPQGTYRDPFKMDREGQFRLTPLPRLLSGQPRKAVIYTQLTISDYNYNAVPVYRPQIGPASVSPFEFIAAARMDKAEEDNTDVISDSPSVALESPREEEEDDDEETVEEDFLPLPEFLGTAQYERLFKPP